MEEFDWKLKSNDSVVVAKTFCQLVSVIKKQYEGCIQEHKTFKDTKELVYLKKKCFDDDPTISLFASNCLISLIKSGMLQTSTMFPEIISTIPDIKCYLGTINALFELLLIDLQSQLYSNTVYRSPFNIATSQHPLITVLIQNSDSWQDVFIKLKYIHNTDDGLYLYGYEMFKPLYLYILCNPNKTHFQDIELKLWTFLLHTYKSDSVDIFYDVIGWLPVTSKSHLYRISSILIESIKFKLHEKDYETVEVLTMYLLSNVYNILLSKIDLYEEISCLILVVKTCNKLKINNYLLMILSEALSICPLAHLKNLLELCLIIIENQSVNILILNSVKIYLLNWVAHQCPLTEEVVKLAKKVLIAMEKNYLKQPLLESKTVTKLFLHLKNTNQQTHFSVEFCSLAEIFVYNNRAIIIWLEKLQNAQQSILKYVFNFVSAIFLVNFEDPIISIKALHVLQKCVEVNQINNTCLQTLILYKLSNTTHPLLHLALLRALPKTAVMRDNLPLVLSILHTLEKGPGNLNVLSIILSYELWDVDNKYYSHLENLFVAEHKKESACSKFEFYTTKAYVIKELCKRRAELYGRGLVTHLSKILNECTSPVFALPCALAIDAITILCKENIVDIETTWATLAPKFCEDYRTQVIISLCAFISQISALPYEFYYNLIETVVEKLWNYATTNANYEVVEAALKSLQSFSFDCISIQVQKELHFSNEEEKVNVETFVSIPDSFWINLLKNNVHKLLWGNFLISLMSVEIENYTRSVYNVTENQGEPFNYKYLQKNSIVKAVGNYLKGKVNNWHERSNKEVYLQCLRIFSQEYSKPLPPMNWSFLQQIVHSPEARHYCISIASHQLIVSGSALHFMENFIRSVTHSCDCAEDIMVLYKNLKYLSNSIQPIILKPFVEKTVDYVVISITENTCHDDKLFNNILINLKDIMTNDDVLQVNKSVVYEIIVDIYKRHKISWNYNEFIKCLCSLPQNLIDEISDLKCQNDLTQEVFKSCVKVRCILALTVTESPLNWIDNIIDNVNLEQLKEKDCFILKNIYPVLQKHMNSAHCRIWLLEVLGKVQALIADSSKETVRILFLCKIFMISIIIISGNNIFISKSVDDFLEEGIHLLFPQSIAFLMASSDWPSICNSQILEWLFHVSNTNHIPEKYKTTFSQSLMALRHTEEFKSNFKWMKYIGNKICVSS